MSRKVKVPEYTYIGNQQQLDRFHQENRSIDWMCFDTEFVGEKRFVTRLCLIQLTTENGNFLIDPFTVKDLSPFLELIQQEKIIKITHAGDNDYRLLYNHYKIVPKNVFDTQLSAGMVGYKYPVSFRRLVESELQIRLRKGYTVADWENRPFEKKHLKYALNDVLPLYDLWKSLEKKLKDRNRYHWAKEEFEAWEVEDLYIKDPNHEALTSNMIKSLNTREQVFLIRVMAWRKNLAKQKNYSKEMVLPNKLLGQIVRTIPSGKEALKHNRRIPGKVVNRYGDDFEKLYQKEISASEKELLKRISADDKNFDPKQDILMEMLYLLMKYKCLENEISPNMVMPKNTMKKIPTEPEVLEEIIKDGWREELLGSAFVNWMENLDQLELNFEDDSIRLRFNGK